jgi:hypothetical protein
LNGEEVLKKYTENSGINPFKNPQNDNPEPVFTQNTHNTLQPVLDDMDSMGDFNKEPKGEHNSEIKPNNFGSGRLTKKQFVKNKFISDNDIKVKSTNKSVRFSIFKKDTNDKKEFDKLKEFYGNQANFGSSPKLEGEGSPHSNLPLEIKVGSSILDKNSSKGKSSL